MQVNAVRLPRTGVEKESRGRSALSECVSRTIHRYLKDIGDTPCKDGLYALVMHEVEAPLLHAVMAHYDNNQSRAAEALGINRATLRKKLTAHGLL